MSALLR